MGKQLDFMNSLLHKQPETHIIICPNCLAYRPFQQLDGYDCHTCTECRFSVFIDKETPQS